jgi:hypothetical protein
MTPHATNAQKEQRKQQNVPRLFVSSRRNSVSVLLAASVWAGLAGEWVVAVSQGWIRAVGFLFDAFDNAKS